MSYCTLIAADKPLPLQEDESCCFGVYEHRYYRDSVNELGYPIKPYQYELSLRESEKALQAFKNYLALAFCSGEVLELWHLWVGMDPGPFYSWSGTMDDLDLDALNAFYDPSGKAGDLCQSRMTITIASLV